MSTFEEKYLTKAVDLMDMLIKSFEDAAGGFFMTAIGQEDVVVRPKDLSDGAIPSGNSMAALVLTRLSVLTGKPVYQHTYERLISAYAKHVINRPSAFCALWCAFMQDKHGLTEVCFKGDSSNLEFAKMLKVLYKDFRPFTVVKADFNKQDLQVQVCAQGVCHLPVTTAQELDKVLST